MPALARLRAFVRNLFRRGRVERDLADELNSYIDLASDEEQTAGLSPTDARRSALVQFGGVERVKEEVRQRRTGRTFDALWEDIRYAFGVLRRAKGFAAAAVLTLGLGIGATSSTFSAVDAIVLQSLPYPEPERLVAVGATWQDAPSVTAPQDYLDWRKRQRVFESLAAYVTTSLTMHHPGGPPEELVGLRVTADFFETLRTPMLHGRAFDAAEEQAGRHQVAVLDHDIWQRKYGGDVGIVGRSIPLEGGLYTVVGIAPRDFSLPVPYVGRPAIWVPLVIPPDDRVRNPSRSTSYLRLIGRLRPGVTVQEAGARMNDLSRALEVEHPEWNNYGRAAVVSLHDFVAGGSTRSWMFLLLGAVTMVLALVCTNVASLMLVRTSVRGREQAIRAALSATRWRIARQLLLESLALSVCGAAVGLLVAWWGIQAIREAMPSEMLRAGSMALNVRVLLLTACLGVVTGMLFGWLPAVRGSSASLTAALGDGGRTGSVRRATWRGRHVLVGTEIALAVVLLIGAELFIGSFANVMRIDLGFDPRHVLTASFDLPDPGVGARLGPAVEQLVERTRGIDGVQSVAVATGTVPLRETITASSTPSRPLQISFSAVTPAYHRSMGIALVRGRYLEDSDLAGSPSVVVIDETTAGKLFPGGDPIGQQLDDMQVVGVVRNVRLVPERGAPPMSYVPWAQTRGRHPVFLFVRAVEPLNVVPALRTALHEVLPGVALRETQTLDAMLASKTAQRRVSMQLLTLFGTLGLAIAALGVYGLMAYVVAQRAREIGIRMALGATRARIVGTFARQAGIIAASGLVVGTAAAIFLGSFAQPFLFELKAADTRILFVAWLVLGSSALVATAVPTRRAAHVDPVRALRQE
jgi:predicted permease